MDFIQDMFAQDAAETTFLIIGIVGLVLLLISVVLDGIFDALSFGDGPLSLTTISAFFGIFGFSALISLTAFDATPALSALFGALPAIVGALGAWGLTRYLKQQEHSDTVSTNSLLGWRASVTLTIPESDGYGEVSVRHNGNVYTFTARADKKILVGTPVEIVDIISNTLVSVKEVTHEVEAPDKNALES